jgi:glycosyltransferase involved in cell wall biosynthesis
MRVLNVNFCLDLRTGGGTAERTFQMSRFLANEGVQCTVLTLDTGLDVSQVSALKPAEVTAVPMLSRRFYVPRFRWKVVRRLVEQADIIHLMGHWSALNVLVCLAAWAARKPYVVCPAGALRIYGRSRLLKNVYNWIVGRRIIRNASAWIAVTEDERAQFATYGVDPGQVIVIPNGVNPADFTGEGAAEFREKHGLGDRPVALFFGRLNSIKGPDILLDAFCRGQHKWSDWHMVFAGPDGGLMSILKSRTAECAARQRVHFIGYVGGKEKSGAYHAADLLVIPSRQEAMSIVVLEAGISGTPVLLTDQCGFDEVARIGGGKVVPATVEGVQAGLANMLTERAKLAAMGSKLRNYVQDNYVWNVVIRKYLDLYSTLLRKA